MPCSFATSAVTCVDSYGSSSSSLGLRKCCSFRIGCSLRNVSKIARLVREIEIAVRGEQALEHELVRGAAAKADVRALVMDDLLGRPVEFRGEAGVAERGERIGGDGDFIVLANGNERGHGLIFAMARRGRRCAAAAKPIIIPSRARAPEPRRRREASRSAAVARDSSGRWPTTRNRRPTPARPILRAAAARESATRRGARAAGSLRQRRGARLLGELFAGGVDRDRHVQIGRRRIAEPALQEDLARRRGEQIGAAHDVRDLLQRVVDDDRELVRVEPVGAPDDEIADVAREVLRLQALQAIAELDARVADAHAHGALRALAPIRRDAVAAGAGVDALAAGADGGRFELAPRARALVDVAARAQPIERRRRRARCAPIAARRRRPRRIRSARAWRGSPLPRRAASAARRRPRCAPATGRRRRARRNSSRAPRRASRSAAARWARARSGRDSAAAANRRRRSPRRDGGRQGARSSARVAGAYSQFRFIVASTAFGYSGRPRLPL